MNNLILAAVCLALALAGVVIRKTYFFIPLRELKRRAENEEEVAAGLYRAAAYGSSLRVLLWLYIGLFTALSVTLFAKQLPIWASLLIVGPLLWLTFSLLPSTRITKPGLWLTRMATPILAGLLNYFHPALSRGALAVEDRYITSQHTDLFEKSDLLEFIEHQQAQPDSRISEEELEIVHRALSFGDQRVSDILTPRKKLKTIDQDDTIGPVLIDELHKSGQPYVIIRDGKKGPIVGSLKFSQLDLHSSGKVRDYMDKTVYYLHERDSLSAALHAFIATNHPIFMVVNDFEESLGVLTIENILRQLLGHIPGDDFDQYTSLAEVAKRHPSRQVIADDDIETITLDDEQSEEKDEKTAEAEKEAEADKNDKPAGDEEPKQAEPKKTEKDGEQDEPDQEVVE
jgi:CBS domain containing-hemolysin-like protein